MKVAKCSDEAHRRICQAAAGNGTYMADALDILIFDRVQPVFRWPEAILANDSSIGQELINEMRKQGVQVTVEREELPWVEGTPARPHNDSFLQV